MTIREPAPDWDAVNDYQEQARDFLAKSRGYLAANDLHQASEKGWGAASHVTKAVAVVYGWEYQQHRDFSTVLNNASRLTGNARLMDLRARANDLHNNYYARKRHLDAEAIGEDLESVAELLELLAPLIAADGNSNAAGE